MTEDEKYWIWLALDTISNPKLFYYLLDTYVDLKDIYNNCREALSLVKGLTNNVIDSLYAHTQNEYIEEYVESLRVKKIEILTRLNPDYPTLLSEIENPPPILFYKGRIPVFDDLSCAVVGSRKPTDRGFLQIQEIASDLASKGVVVVSGMAKGIDAAAHIGALRANGSTAAVLGSGIDVIYPSQNKMIYDELAEKGVIISEYLPGTPPRARNFPRRNRIISGLSKAVLVGESGERSGARITVNYAVLQCREVYAVPYDPASELGAFPHELDENGVAVIASADEIIRDMGWCSATATQSKPTKKLMLPKRQTRQKKKIAAKHETPKKEEVKNSTHRPDEKELNLDLLESKIYNLLLRENNLTSDEIAAFTKASAQDISVKLTMLEMRNIIEAGPGNLFQIKDQ